MIGVLAVERSGFLYGWCGCDQHFNSSQKFVQFEWNTHTSQIALCNLLVMGRQGRTQENGGDRLQAVSGMEPIIQFNAVYSLQVII